MKLLYFGDRHYQENKPSTRLDDFQATSRMKDEEILSIARKHDVSALLHPGDFWDKSIVSDEFIQDVVKRWKQPDVLNLIDKAKSLGKDDISDILKKDIPLIGIAGNHDLHGGDINSLNNTTTGLLKFLGVTKLVSKEEPYFLETEDGLTVAITGTSYHSGIDMKENIDDYIVHEKLGDVHIHIVHGMLTPKAISDDIMRYTLIDDILETKADITLCGHDHIGFGVIKVDDKYFVNIGSVTRIQASKKEISRIPKVLLIEINKTVGIKVEEIKLQSAEEGHKVLNRKVIEKTKEKKIKKEEYKKEIKKFGLIKSANLYEMMEEVAKNHLIPDEIKDDLIIRTSEKEKEMTTIASNKDEVYIRQMILENFQSHKSTVLNFKEGLNVLIGETSNGKTSVIRGLRWVYQNKPTGRNFIRKGEDYARVTLKLSNGYIVSRMVEANRNGFNGYEIIEPDGNKRTGNTRLLPEVQKILGYNDFSVDKDLTVPLNFMFQGDSWFLIGDKYSSPDRAKIIGAVKGTHYIDAVKRDLEKENRRLVTDIEKDKENVERLNKEIEKYMYLDDLKLKLETFERLMKEIDESIKLKQQIETKLSEYKNTEEKIKENEEIISKFEKLNKAIISFNKVKDDQNILDRIVENVEQYKVSEKRLSNAKAFIKITENIYDLNSIFEDTVKNNELKEKISKEKLSHKRILLNIEEENEKINKTSNLESLKDTYDNIKVNIEKLKKEELVLERAIELTSQKNKAKRALMAIEMTLNETSKIEELKGKFNDINDKVSTLEEIKELNKEYDDLSKKIKKEDSVIKNKKEEITAYVNQYKNLLKDTKVCPICYGDLDNARINQIVKKYSEKND